jgi:hypothetical protein
MTTTPYAITNASSTVIREELSNVITNIDPVETPFINNIKKGKSSSFKTEWITDSLAAAALNQQNENATVSYTAAAIGVRKASYLTYSTKWFAITDLMEVMDSVERATTIGYRTANCLKEIARDIEYTLINEDTGATSDPFKTYGLKYWLGSSHGTNYANFGGTAVTNLLTEPLFISRQQAIWNQGGNANMVLSTAAQKLKIDDFNGSNRQTVNTDAGNKKIANVVDMYESSFGTVRIYLERHINPDSTYYDWMFFLQKSLWEYLTVVPIKTEKLGKTGTFTVVQIQTAYNMKCLQEKGNAALFNLYNA